MMNRYNNLRYNLNLIKLLDLCNSQVDNAKHYSMNLPLNNCLNHLYPRIMLPISSSSSDNEPQSWLRVLVNLNLATPFNHHDPESSCHISRLGSNYIKRYSNYRYCKFWNIATHIGAGILYMVFPVGLLMMFAFPSSLISLYVIFALMVVAIFPATLPTPERLRSLNELEFINLITTPSNYPDCLNHSFSTNRFIIAFLKQTFVRDFTDTL